MVNNSLTSRYGLQLWGCYRIVHPPSLRNKLGMAISNAERQKRYRQRLKVLAVSGSNAVRKLNEVYNTAAAEQRDSALKEVRRKIARSKDEKFILAMEDMIARLPPPSYEWTIDDWCRIAQLLGQKDEAANVSEAEKEALRQLPKRQLPKKPRRPWAPFRYASVAKKNTLRKVSGKPQHHPWAPFSEEGRGRSETSEASSRELL